MRSPLRLALCQINTVPGDIPGNVAKIREAANRAAGAGAELAVFPELAVVGYSPRDLLFRRRFAESAAAAIEDLAGESQRVALLVGTVLARSGPGRPFNNGALLLDGGRVRAAFCKTLLPVYDVFDEARYFEAGPGTTPFDFRGWKLGVTICEDIWADSEAPEVPEYDDDPPASLVHAGADVILNLSASPYHVGKPAEREALVGQVARRVARPVLLCNLWGANDEIIFDGASVAADASGRIIARGARFGEDLVVVDLPVAAEEAPPPAGDPIEELRCALVLGIRDYAHKTGFQQAIVGLSGGVDSALTCALAVEALGAENVQGLAMPSRFSSPESLEDAGELARRLGIRFAVAGIDAAYAELAARAADVVGPGEFGLMEENIQARVRGVLLMAVSNRTGALLITTGNKSELAVGYCTLYGDMCGGLAAISDVYKTDVWRLARWYQERGLIPLRTLTRAPSAELRPGQKDQDSLPPYDLLDRVLELHVDAGLGTRDIVARLPEAPATLVDEILAMVARSEYKRKQAAPGLKVSRKAFGYGRRVPLVASTLAFLDRPGRGGGRSVVPPA